MLKSRVSKFLVLLATLTLAIVLSACGNSQSNSSTQSKTELGDKTIEILILQVIIQLHVHL